MATLGEYKRKRDFKATPEPAGRPRRAPREKLPRFVVQEHHATRLHWDFRLEREGVLVSWAVPKGIPPDPRKNHLAVHVEDHPLDYIDFAGEIPSGNYGAGQVSIWDQGSYETHKWELDAAKGEVMVTLHGHRVQGRYVLFQTRGKDWMIHRMDPPQDAGREPLPESVEPMLARLVKEVPANAAAYGFEFKWDGIRAILRSDSGTVRLSSRSGEDVTSRYPELRAIGVALGSRQVILDGEVVALDDEGRPSFEQIQQRMGLRSESEIRRRMKEVPVYYMAFDVVYLEGHSLLSAPYRERRRLLAGLQLTGRNWQTPEHQEGEGSAMKAASQQAGLEGIMAKRLDSPYEPGGRSGAWLKIKNHERQELVIGGWLEGEGRRSGLPGALLVGYHRERDLVYAGKVGTGFTEAMLEKLAALMEPLAVESSPFTAGAKPSRASHFVKPVLVAEFEFSEWTRAGQLRAPAFKGLRSDKDAYRVVREG